MISLVGAAMLGYGIGKGSRSMAIVGGLIVVGSIVLGVAAMAAAAKQSGAPSS